VPTNTNPKIKEPTIMKMNNKAFSVLKLEEKSSLSLQKVHNKSTWQAGEILERSHYKYLEIKQRAEKFFELFTNHYNTYGKLIPEGVEINKYVEQYLILCIEQRLKIRDVVNQIDNDLFQKEKTRDPIIEKTILDLKKSHSLHAQNLYNTIMDFDKYNNYRILPKSVQEPSAFKRRNKTRFKKHLTISVTLQPYSLYRIEELFDTKAKNIKEVGYVSLAEYPHSAKIIRINANSDNMRLFSSLSMYIFREKSKAEEYKNLIFSYLDQTNRDPKRGLLFWPEFRNLIKESINYDLVNNIAPTRKSLATAIADMDILYKKKKDAREEKQRWKDGQDY
jgi:hypothetical protein